MRVAAGSPPAIPESTPELRRAVPADALARLIDGDGRAAPGAHSELPSPVLLAMHREMVRARSVDAAMVELQRQGRIPSYAAAEGQEAVAVGAVFALEATDWVFPAFRENAVLLARGFSLDRYVAQLLGSALDTQKGRQAPGYMSARSLRVVSTSSAVATQLPHAVGMAWAARRERSRVAVLAFVGDGGTSSGDFHAALNFAGVFRAPCIVVVQNNQWAMSTPSTRQTASVSFAAKGRAYGVPALRVDGADVLAVHQAVAAARAQIASGGGATLIECVTTGAFHRPSLEEEHEGAGAPSWDRVPGESHAALDPILRLRRHLVQRALLDDGAVRLLEAEITEEIARAVDRGEAVSAPERATLFEDVYAARPWHLDEQAKPPRRR